MDAHRDPAENPSIFDDLPQDVLIEAGIPEYLAEPLAEIASRGWSVEAWGDYMRQIERHVQPMFDKAQAEMDSLRRNRRAA